MGKRDVTDWTQKGNQNIDKNQTEDQCSNVHRSRQASYLIRPSVLLSSPRKECQKDFSFFVSKLPMPSSSLDTHGSLLRAKHRVGRILLDYDGFAVL